MVWNTQSNLIIKYKRNNTELNSAMEEGNESYILDVVDEELQPRPPLAIGESLQQSVASSASHSTRHSSSVIADYIRRFRFAAPTPPSLRDQPASRDAFWWLEQQKDETGSRSVYSNRSSAEAANVDEHSSSYHETTENKGSKAWFGLEEILSHSPDRVEQNSHDRPRSRSPPRQRLALTRQSTDDDLQHSDASDSDQHDDEDRDDLQEYAKRLLSKCDHVLAMYRQDQPSAKEDEREGDATMREGDKSRTNESITSVLEADGIPSNYSKLPDEEEGDEVVESWTSEQVREALINLSVEEEDEDEREHFVATDVHVAEETRRVEVVAASSPVLHLPGIPKPGYPLQQPSSSMSPLLRSLNLSITSPHSPMTQSQQSSVMFLSSSSEDLSQHLQQHAQHHRTTDIAFRSLESLHEDINEEASPEEKRDLAGNEIHIEEDDDLSYFPLHNNEAKRHSLPATANEEVVHFDEDLVKQHLSDSIVAQLYARLLQVQKEIKQL